MIPCLPVPKEERPDVVLLAFLDQIAKALIQRSKPKSARYNRLLQLRKAVEKVDETYKGYLPDTLQNAAQELLETLEQKIVHLNDIPVTEENMDEALSLHP